MKITQLNSRVSVSEQITIEDVKTLANDGVQLIICNRPDGEASGQTPYRKIAEQAKSLGLETQLIDFSSSFSEQQLSDFQAAISQGKKTHLYCRTGNRSKKIYNASHDCGCDDPDNGAKVIKAGYDAQRFDIVIIGAGSGGIAASASLLKRDSHLRIAIIEPSKEHFYQPGWTMVGAGVFDAESTKRGMACLIDRRVNLIEGRATAINAKNNVVIVDEKMSVYYDQLIVAPGLVIKWDAIEGLEESLGKNGVTSNYRYDLAPYTWQLVQNLKEGKALFTQPPMPIKCAGAPQKAMYLSGDHWFKNGSLNNIDIEFCNAGGVLFGVSDYVPALMSYIEKYQATLSFNSTLVKIDGESKQAWFEVANANGEIQTQCKTFDMIHVCPPQVAPDFVAESGLADVAGWLDVDPGTLQHKTYANIWGVGDVMNTTNAKTMAAARKQVPVVADNIISVRANQKPIAIYDGYGSCPLTVERGKIVLAEFCYGGRVSPTFPTWLLDGTKPTSAAWRLKAQILPTIYWQCMLKGREWLTDCPEFEAASVA